jgi:hypothetical protein
MYHWFFTWCAGPLSVSAPACPGDLTARAHAQPVVRRVTDLLAGARGGRDAWHVDQDAVRRCRRRTRERVSRAQRLRGGAQRPRRRRGSASCGLRASWSPPHGPPPCPRRCARSSSRNRRLPRGRSTWRPRTRTRTLCSPRPRGRPCQRLCPSRRRPLSRPRRSAMTRVGGARRHLRACRSQATDARRLAVADVSVEGDDTTPRARRRRKPAKNPSRADSD